MRTHARLALQLVAVMLVLSAGLARAGEVVEVPAAPEEKAKPEPGQGDHVEFCTGFIVGGRNYRHTAFAFKDGSASQTAGAGGLVAPFAQYPYDGIVATGVRWDFRAIISHVRMTVGFGLPFPTLDGARASGQFDVGGVQRQVVSQSLQAYELRFGMGGEYSFGRVALYGDLLGDVHWVRTTLAIDGLTANYGATTFAFAAGAGVRVNLKGGFFLSTGAEVGFVGDIAWNAQLIAGFLFDV